MNENRASLELFMAFGPRTECDLNRSPGARSCQPWPTCLTVGVAAGGMLGPQRLAIQRFDHGCGSRPSVGSHPV